MGKPLFGFEDIPLSKKINPADITLEINNKIFTGGFCVNIGNPHIIFFVKNCFEYDLKIIGPKIAKKFYISLIVYGENQAEYGNQIKENSSFNMNNNFFSVEDKFDIGDIKFGGQSVKKIINNTDFIAVYLWKNIYICAIYIKSWDIRTGKYSG